MWIAFTSWLGDHLHSLNPTFKTAEYFKRVSALEDVGVVDTFYSPTAAIAESIVVVSLSSALLCYFAFRQPWTRRVSSSGSDRASFLGVLFSFFSAWVDVPVRVVLALSYAASVWYKYTSVGGPLFLLMPCHLITAAVVALSLVPSSASPAVLTAAAYANNVAFVLLWGPILALVFPETESLLLPGEVVHYYLYHVIIMVLPALWILSGRFRAHSGAAPFFVAWAIYIFMNCIPTQFAALLSGRNVAFMLTPPTTVEDLVGLLGGLFGFRPDEGIQHEFSRYYFRQAFSFVAAPVLSAIVHFGLGTLLFGGLVCSTRDRASASSETSTSRLDVQVAKEVDSGATTTAAEERGAGGKKARKSRGALDVAATTTITTTTTIATSTAATGEKAPRKRRLSATGAR